MADGLRKGLTSYGDAGFSLFLRKAFIKAMGYSDDALNRPIVGITNTYSDYNPCHGNVPADHRGGEARRDAGRRACRWCSRPSRSQESFSHPTSMYLRNLMAMDTEEMIRAQPMDAVIVIGGCDKTLPAQIMAAVSGRSADGRHPGRADGGRPSQGRGAGRLHRLPPPVGQVSRRRDRRGRDRGGQRPARAVRRHLHGDGHRQHHGLHHRGAGPVAADERDDSRRRMPSACARRKPAAGVAAAMAKAKGPKPSELMTQGLVQQRAGGAAGDRRLDQRPHSSDRDRRPHRASHRSRQPSTSSAARCRC